MTRQNPITSIHSLHKRKRVIDQPDEDTLDEDYQMNNAETDCSAREGTETRLDVLSQIEEDAPHFIVEEAFDIAKKILNLNQKVCCYSILRRLTSGPRTDISPLLLFK
jgi:hypothetical protein